MAKRKRALPVVDEAVGAIEIDGLTVRAVACAYPPPESANARKRQRSDNREELLIRITEHEQLACGGCERVDLKQHRRVDPDQLVVRVACHNTIKRNALSGDPLCTVSV